MCGQYDVLLVGPTWSQEDQYTLADHHLLDASSDLIGKFVPYVQGLFGSMLYCRVVLGKVVCMILGSSVPKEIELLLGLLVS